MSLLSTVERAIEACKAEQAKINGSIQLYRDMLHTLTLQPKMGSDESDCAEAAATDTYTSPRENEDIELLERALEKALRVRTGTGGLSKKDPDRNKQLVHLKELAAKVGTSKEGMEATASSKGNQTTNRTAYTSASRDRKKLQKPGTSVSSTLGSKSSENYKSGQCKTTINRDSVIRASQQAVSASGSLGRGQLHGSALRSQGGSDLDKASAISATSSISTMPVSHGEESRDGSLPQQNGKASDQTAKWKSLRSKQNRLWDKVVALQRKPEPGRGHFMERMRATFPKDWPGGCPDQTRALVDRLAHRGLDLTQHCQTEELLNRQIPEAATELGVKPNTCDSLTLERLQMTAAELRLFAEQAKDEWEAWDRWRPEGGCLCPSGANGVRGDGRIAPLPPTITYTTEGELRKLEMLRMRVALLQQEVYLEQALLDTLSPHLPSIATRPGCPNAGVLRDMYSLLGEGGERFPAVVMDSEPD